MSDAESPEEVRKRPEAAAGGGAGVLGNLPRSRPSVRSPRRAAAEKPDPPARAEPVPGEERSAPSSQAELEALARSGMAIAGGAASLGLRLAGRAATAVRDVVERR